MENAVLKKDLQELKGRMIAADFAIKLLIAHIPDLLDFQAHWDQMSGRAMDGAMDYSSNTCTASAAVA